MVDKSVVFEVKDIAGLGTCLEAVAFQDKNSINVSPSFLYF